MAETVNVQEMGQQVLHQLEEFNKRIWDAISFRMIHALMAEEPLLKDSYVKTQQYRKERGQKALAQTQGDQRKAYQLLASENFN